MGQVLKSKIAVIQLFLNELTWNFQNWIVLLICNPCKSGAINVQLCKKMTNIINIVLYKLISKLVLLINRNITKIAVAAFFQFLKKFMWHFCEIFSVRNSSVWKLYVFAKSQVELLLWNKTFQEWYVTGIIYVQLSA